MTDDRHRPDRDGCGLVRWFLDLIEDAVEAALREIGKCQHGGAGTPLPPGGTATPVTVQASAVTLLTAAAIGARYAAPGQPPPARVIWQDGIAKSSSTWTRPKRSRFPAWCSSR